VGLIEYKCPNCGGPITFAPKTQEMACPYCDSTLNVEVLLALDKDLDQVHESEPLNWGYLGNEWQTEEQEGMVVYSCRSCAGEIIADETLGATSCPFCDSPVVLSSKFSGSLRPDLIIPFQVTKEEAFAALKKHYLGKKLLPKVFQDQNHLEEVKGVYVPFWLFDAEVDANVEYNATKVRVWSDRDYKYSETSFFRVFRSGKLGFKAIPVDGSEVVDDFLMQSIEPFQLDAATKFQSPYLAGYFANKYDIDANTAEIQATKRIENSTAATFEDTVTGFATVTPRHTEIKLNSSAVKYALLPVWFLSTRWQNESFTFAMNGQTGKFVGDLPVDRGAYWRLWGKAFLLATGPVLALFWLAINSI
jgi:DNA-directed RNA polymerase subunit RPC12/RpoP